MSVSQLVQPKILLVLICIFFLFTRLYKITEIPSSVYWDEASIGYNAYSIAHTGKDEWDKAFPIHFRAFGEFKLPVYIYAVAPSVWIFGLNAFSVRLPSVLFSLGIVILTFFLAKKLSGSTAVGLFSSFFISTSPWFFIFSRTGYEVTAGLMFYLLAIYLFLKLDTSRWYILFSIISFVLSIYSYNSFRLIAPLTILLLVVFHIKNVDILKRSVLPIFLSIIILIIAIIPIYRLYVYDAGASRLQVVSASSSDLVKNYLSHFSLDFLLLNGDKNLRSQQPGFGQLYLPELILLLLGLLHMVKNKSKYRLMPLALLLLGPIPAAITKESPHALRAISMVPFIAMISAEGVNYLGEIIKKRYIFYPAIIIIFFGFFLNLFINFLNVYPVKSSKDWQYGYQQAVNLVNKKIFTGYDRVIISDEYAQPYIFALFYQKTAPDIFRQTVVRNSVDQWGFSTVAKFGKFEFGKIGKLLEGDSKNTLVFASGKEFIPNLSPSGIINFLNGEIAFRVYKLK
ncbi:glycosyltransferase family 39 protein [Patescibacteria group bacterium]|nr:glycosyltransferase family 39 protein [Patescibacteria group bacterium]